MRIIGAQEAAEAVARGDAGKRRAEGEPGYGDRPDDPIDDDGRPVLRFPTPYRRTRDAVVPSASPPPLRGRGAAAPDESVDRAPHLITVPPQPDESFELPHYTDPPTGQVPKVVIDEDDPSDSWSGLGAVRTGSDQEQNFDDADDFSDLVDSGPRLGALEWGDRGRSRRLLRPRQRLRRLEWLRRRLRGDPRQPTCRGASHARRKGGRGGADHPTAGRNLPDGHRGRAALAILGLLCFKLGAVATTILVAVILWLAPSSSSAAVRDSGYNPATLLGLVAVAALAIAPLCETGDRLPDRSAASRSSPA